MIYWLSFHIFIEFVEGGIGEDFVWKAISIALYNYSADQIARFDFALESAGGRVSETSTSYDPSQSRAKIFGFTLPITLSRNTPNAVIQVTMYTKCLTMLLL